MRARLEAQDGASTLPLRLLLLGLVAMWNPTQQATRTVPKEMRLAKVEMEGIYVYELLDNLRYWRWMR